MNITKVRFGFLYRNNSKTSSQRRGDFMDFKIVDDINISKEELDYYENHDFGEEIRKGLEDGTAIVAEGNWDETVKAVKAKMAANATKAITIRVPVRVIERYKKRAAAAGIGYQTLMKQMLEAAPV